MGICCSSCQSEPETPTTAKLIHQDGLLQEFDYPVKVSHIINPREIFICNSDEMDFGDVASPVSSDSELQLGQLYFALPVSRLSQPLPAEEIAALAVKAHEVLMKYGGFGSVVKSCSEYQSKTTPDCEEGKKAVAVGGRKNGRSRRKVFAANLSLIEE